MKTYLVFILFLIPFVIQAQKQSSNIDELEYITHQPNTWSVGVGKIIGITNDAGMGGIVSVKYVLSSKSQFRFGIVWSSSNYFSEDDYVQSGNVEDIKNEDLVGGFLDYLYYLNIYDPIKIYLNGGARFGHRKQEFSEADNFYSDKYNFKSDQFYLGLSTKLGVEWLLSKYVGISLEYGLFALYFNSDYDKNYPQEDDNKGDGDWGRISSFSEEIVQDNSGQADIWEFRSNQFVIGFNIYF